MVEDVSCAAHVLTVNYHFARPATGHAISPPRSQVCRPVSTLDTGAPQPAAKNLSLHLGADQLKNNDIVHSRQYDDGSDRVHPVLARE
jgi:hypothetical protein